MTRRITFTVNGPPVAKARARSGRNGFYTPAKTAAYERSVKAEAALAMRGLQVFDGPVSVWVRAMVPIPKSWSKAKRGSAALGFTRPTGKPDVDNYVKAAFDGMQGVVFKDDAQVVFLDAAKVYSTNPMLHVSVSETGANLTEVSR